VRVSLCATTRMFMGVRKRVEAQLKDIQGKSDKKRQEVRYPAGWVYVPALIGMKKLVEIQTALQQEQQGAAAPKSVTV
jgi:hypothetical protein